MSARWALFLQEGGRRNSLFHRSLGSKFFFDMGKDRVSFPKGRGHLIKKRSGGKDCLQLVQFSRATSYSTIGYRQLLSTLRFWRLGLLMGLLLSTGVLLRHQPPGVCSLSVEEVRCSIEVLAQSFFFFSTWGKIIMGSSAGASGPARSLAGAGGMAVVNRAG